MNKKKKLILILSTKICSFSVLINTHLHEKKKQMYIQN